MALSLEDVRKMAADIGLTRFSESQLQELLRAANAAQARRGKLKIEQLTYADEPAHVYRLDTPEAR
jgi:hypothetical protein